MIQLLDLRLMTGHSSAVKNKIQNELETLEKFQLEQVCKNHGWETYTLDN